MENTLKFTGTIKNLKKIGCTFHKLYANNYKVYQLDLGKGNKFWIWVHHGGYIEFKDLFDNTLNLFNALKSIDWDTVQTTTTGRLSFRFNHDDSSKGYELKAMSMGVEEAILFRERFPNGIPENLSDEEYNSIDKIIRKDYDREIILDRERAEKLLKTFEMIQNS